MTYDVRLADQYFKSSISRKCMKAKTHGNTKPRQERIVDIRNMLESLILSRNLGAKTFENQTFGVPRLST